MSLARPWYGAGLRFACQRCGACCTGDPGAVWVSEGEIAALAEWLGLTTDELERRYVRRRGIRLALHERFNGDCIFYDRDAGGCRVHAARPAQCRAWPFWEGLVASQEDWRAASETCPGCGRGDLVSHQAIQRHLAALAAARAAEQAPSAESEAAELDVEGEGQGLDDAARVGPLDVGKPDLG